MTKKNVKYDDVFTEQDKENIRKDYVENYLSLREVCKKYNIKSNSYAQKVLKSVMRNISDANILAHKKHPNSFKHTEESKQKIREYRLKYMREHPEDTAWRKRNKPSYPEECFIKFLQERGYDKKYLIEREKSIFPYFIDFAFVDIKLAIEIDGSQHLNEDRKKRDGDKDKLLTEQGWKILRISENIVKTDWDIIDNKIQELISNKDISYEIVGIIKYPKNRQKVERDEFGYSEKQKESSFNQRKVKDRPTKEELFEMIKVFPFTEIGKKYGVTDNTIRKWCKMYRIPFRKKDL